MMRVRDRVGLNVPPLLLRAMLGVVFLWAGLGKVSNITEMPGEAAAVLANMGVIKGPSSVVPPAAPVPTPAPAKQAPAKPSAPTGKSGRIDGGPAVWLASQPVTEPKYTAADFPQPVRIRQVYGLAVAIKNAADPVAAAGEPAPMRLWPAQLGHGNWPVYQAWAVAMTELAGGCCLILGLLTRFWALAVAGVMLGAIWLTQLGPAMQSGKAVLWILPAYPTFDTRAWQPLLFQFSLLMAALALAFCGPGRASLDTALLTGRSDEDDDE
jgi:uncharacterized membrane protein YphA (DoxX/SURF4 family)